MVVPAKSLAPMSRKTGQTTPRDRLVEAATELFCQYGFNAVGVDAIVERAGTAKTTLYKLFGSKDGLVEAVLQAEGAAWRDWFVKSTTRASATPRGRLDAIFPVLAIWFRQKRFYGCPFINAVAEHDKTSDRVRSLAIEHKMQVLTYIRDLGAAAGAQDPERLMHEIALLMDGAIVTAMVTRSAAAAGIAQAAMHNLVEAQIQS
jgi:AcrR family transcriptional regulator